MAFTEEYNQPQRWDQFHYYTTQTVALPFTGANISLGPGVLWKLEEIRVHWSSTFASAEAIQGKVSSINGSYYNTILFSQDMNGADDIRIFWSQPLLFFSDDVLWINFSNLSAVNVCGIEAIGWAVRG